MNGDGKIFRHPNGTVVQGIIKDGIYQEVTLVPPDFPKPRIRFKDPDEPPPPPPPWSGWEPATYFDAQELQLIDDLRFALQGDGTKAPIPWVIKTIAEWRVARALAEVAKQQPPAPAPQPAPFPSVPVPDEITGWIAERVIVGPEHNVTSAAAYEDYCGFVGSNPMSQRRFALALAGKGFARVTIEGKRGFAGLGLKG